MLGNIVSVVINGVPTKTDSDVASFLMTYAGIAKRVTPENVDEICATIEDAMNDPLAAVQDIFHPDLQLTTQDYCQNFLRPFVISWVKENNLEPEESFGESY